MLYYLRITGQFIRASFQQEMAYPANFAISLLHSGLNLLTGVLGIIVLFNQVETVQGWTFASTLAILGVYLTMNALRGVFISPSLDSLAGMDGDIWTGKLDYVLLRPADIQFLASFRHWRPYALLDLLLGIGVMVVAAAQLQTTLTLTQIASFMVLLAVGLVVMYALLLAFAGLVFWSPGFLFGWVFDGLFQMARYPVSLYPEGIRLVLTWVVPIGVMTTVPAQALTGDLPPAVAVGSVLLGLGLLVGATVLFRTGVRRYSSASS